MSEKKENLTPAQDFVWKVCAAIDARHGFQAEPTTFDFKAIGSNHFSDPLPAVVIDDDVVPLLVSVDAIGKVKCRLVLDKPAGAWTPESAFTIQLLRGATPDKKNVDKVADAVVRARRAVWSALTEAAKAHAKTVVVGEVMARYRALESKHGVSMLPDNTLHESFSLSAQLKHAAVPYAAVHAMSDRRLEKFFEAVGEIVDGAQKAIGQKISEICEEAGCPQLEEKQ